MIICDRKSLDERMVELSLSDRDKDAVSQLIADMRDAYDDESLSYDEANVKMAVLFQDLKKISGDLDGYIVTDRYWRPWCRQGKKEKCDCPACEYARYLRSIESVAKPVGYPDDGWNEKIYTYKDGTKAIFVDNEKIFITSEQERAYLFYLDWETEKRREEMGYSVGFLKQFYHTLQMEERAYPGAPMII